jgi:hypothetical protein
MDGVWRSGLYLNAGAGQRNYAVFGGALERTLSPGATIGAELYHQGADTLTDRGTTGANVGAIFTVGAYHAILCAFGRTGVTSSRSDPHLVAKKRVRA